MRGLLITFEGTEGSGKSTQIDLLAGRLRKMNFVVRTLREPGGTPIGEVIRHTLKHSPCNQAMTAEAELLLMNASRAQLVREVIRPALRAGEIILCDRFYDSTTAYQGYGRGLDLKLVRTVVNFAVGETRPDLTFLFTIPLELSEARRSMRQALELKSSAGKNVAGKSPGITRDRIEEADRTFFERVEKGYLAIAAAEPERIRVIDATRSLDTVSTSAWRLVRPLLKNCAARR